MLKMRYLDWEIDIPVINTTKAADGQVSVAQSKLGTEVVITPVDEYGFASGFTLEVEGTIKRIETKQAGKMDFLTMGFIQNLRTSVRAAWYANGGREHLLTRRPVDRLPLIDHSTHWYKEKDGNGRPNKDATAVSTNADFKLQVDDTPHTGFPETCPPPGAGQLLRAALGGAFTTCFTLERSWDSKRYALFAVDWVMNYRVGRSPNYNSARKPVDRYACTGGMTIGSWKYLAKLIDAAGIVDTGTTPNLSEHVFVDGLDKGPTASA
jgi:hypothetical protein